MTFGLAYRLDLWARHALPAVTILVLVMLASLPFTTLLLPQIAAGATVMAVFYWTVYRPDLLPPAVVLLIGLAQDLLVGTPLGLQALVMLLTYGITLSQRRTFIGKPFALAWLGFAVISAGSLALAWLLVCLVSDALTLAPGLPLRYALTVGGFPFATWLFVRLHRYLER